MRIYTKAGDLAFRTFTFPDGQPHFKLETYDVEFDEVTIELALKSPADLFLCGLVVDVLRASGYSRIHVDIRYLLAARMDRVVSPSEPCTLLAVSRIINGWGASRIRILDGHSDVAFKVIRNATNLLPVQAVRQVLVALNFPDVVIPDKGAIHRVRDIIASFAGFVPWVHQCYKVRNPSTGALSNFTVPHENIKGRDLLIVDDICDGGGTFTGLAKELKAGGADSVNLFVTHGIFSKGLPLAGVDHVYATDSYQNTDHWTDEMGPDVVTIIPISMKEL